MTTLVQMLLGVVDLYWDMVASKLGFERYIAIGYFFLYIIFMFFIVINIFLAILNDAYAGVKSAPHPSLSVTLPVTKRYIAITLQSHCSHIAVTL